MKKALAILLAATVILTLCACGHEHTWAEATCTEPRTCTGCGATEGEPLGHTWKEATCTEPKTCSVCGATEGEPLGHTWKEATCTEVKACSICGATEGEPLGHDYSGWEIVREPTYLSPGGQMNRCRRCEETIYEELPQLSLDNCLIVDKSGMTVTYEECYYILEEVLSGKTNYMDSNYTFEFRKSQSENIRFMYVEGIDTSVMVTCMKNGDLPEPDEAIDYILITLVGDSASVTDRIVFIKICSLAAILITHSDFDDPDEALEYFNRLLDKSGSGDWTPKGNLEYLFDISTVGSGVFMLSFGVRVRDRY